MFYQLDHNFLELPFALHKISQMTAQVNSSFIRVLMEEQSGNSDILITKDFLGNLSKAKDLDLEFKTGKVEAKKLSSSPLSTKGSVSQDSKLQDLNFPPTNLFEEMTTTSLDLKLQSCSATTPSRYQSVCTLDKVKYALERAETGTVKKRSSSSSPQPPSSSPTQAAATAQTKMFAAACPGCLLYVIASNTNPRCPRCNSFVPSSSPLKKPRIDLNASF